MAQEITITIEDTTGTETSHTIAPRPWDQFGFLKWAGPTLGITGIQDDPMAFGLYGAIRALQRTGVLDRAENLADQMQRVTGMDYTDDEDTAGAAVDPTTPAP